MKSFKVFLMVALLVLQNEAMAASCDKSASESKKVSTQADQINKFSAEEVVRELKNLYRRKDKTFRMDRLSPENLEAAFDLVLAELELKIADFSAKQLKPNFRNTIVKLEDMFRDYAQMLIIVESISLNQTKLYKEVEANITKKSKEFDDRYRKNEIIAKRVNEVVASLQNRKLPEDSRRLLNEYKKIFSRLDEASEKRLLEIELRLTELADKFTGNVLEATEKTFVEFTEAELKGFSKEMLESGKDLAEQNGNPNYLFNPIVPVLSKALSSLELSSSREKIYRAYAQLGITSEFNNRPIIKEILQLRQEKAKLKSFNNFAEYSISEKAAPSLEVVKSFLEDLRDLYFHNAKIEIAKIRAYKEKATGDSKLYAWDYAYWNEKLMKEEIGISEQELKPYLSFYSFQTAFHKRLEDLYGIEIVERKDLPSFDSESQSFEIRKDGKSYAFLYADSFAKSGKRSGAWMTEMISGYRDKRGNRKIPTATINLNIMRAKEGQTTFMSPNEAVTYAHEFGHALHAILSNARYYSQFGTRVAWDVVEVPSQFNENLVLDKDFIKSFAVHHETKEVIPDHLVDGFIKSLNFNAGYAGLRQTAYLGLLDLEFHRHPDMVFEDPVAFEQKFVESYNLFDKADFQVATSGKFNHIFTNGGYSAGYYSYKWAEIIEADVFRFLSQSKDPAKVMDDWIKKVISIGGSSDFNQGVESVLGRKIDPSALVERAGLEIPK